MTANVGSYGRIVRVQSLAAARRLSLCLVTAIEHWLERSRQRRALLEAGDHLLKDIGLSRAEAYREGAKPFWRG